MRGPAVAGWLLVALCGVTGLYCLLRMRRCAGGRRREAGSEAVMGLGMAVMGVPAVVVAPPEWSWAVYATVFGAASVRAAWALRGSGPGGHHLHHLVGSLAMVYMAVPAAGSAAGGVHAGHIGHVGHAGGGVPLVTGALLAYYAVWVLRAGTRLVPLAATASGPAAAGEGEPELADACRLVMAVAMLAMLCTV
ncbi:DUF5134 domain-containing protein [Streptomyces sp. TRM49041]|uniref:DUF5134 domain-containing protein n=1 Tax=Streptomyces sp. TRM49041 TaxID=2603216 RepID=UPI0011EF9167|nr:DUF5134 domain-containing protein [Streptomyces sp. TRM49041]